MSDNLNLKKTIAKTKPTRMWIDGKCFTLKKYKGLPKKLERSQPTQSQNDKSEEDEASDAEDELPIYNIEFDTADNGIISTSFELPPWYYSKLKNDEAASINKLKISTKTKISIPDYGKQEKILILGDHEDNVREALNEIYAIVGHIRHRSIPVQFININLANDEIQNNFIKFKTEVLKFSDVRGLDESIFITPVKLHITVEVLVLLNDREVNEGAQALDEYVENYLKPLAEKTGPLKIQVRGIECMNEDYEHVDILYAKPKIVNETDEFNLQNIVNKLSAHFYEKGLLKKHQDNVKLHMSMMNTKYRKLPWSPYKKWRKRINFDATKIMDKFKDYEFGQCDFKDINISLITTTTPDGCYKSIKCASF